ncbi:ChaN family lipoprotein [Pseudomonas sp. ABC1]|uniref:ChaN family lipoprotein n=1 Tax=Pseudomonas sp. ABC1 TaxID=2748080 RepID=UPI0015C40772|nr:ChaN family lipoprotein [Pseudomonas sp. ABC1]QLF92970.1 ChaN family lipoprotein [Pseudomonas sp. ABC1]
MRTLSFVALVLLLVGCKALPPLPQWQGTEGLQHEDVGLIVDLRAGTALSPEQLVEALSGADRILLGEQHDNADHHALQLWLLQALESRREAGALLLEMLEPRQQGRVDRLRVQTDLPDDIPGALEWQRGWDWSLYGPLVVHGLRQKAPLLAANLDSQEMREIYRESRSITGKKTNDPELHEALSRQLKASHCGMLPAEKIPAMLSVQLHRDRRMAEALLAAPVPAVLLAGAEHARKDRGVPLHLADLGDTGRISVLILANAGRRIGAEQADYVWYTPAPARQDYCEQMRQHMNAAGKPGR